MSPVRNILHDQASEKPQIPVVEPVDFQYAAILPMLQSKATRIYADILVFTLLITC